MADITRLVYPPKVWVFVKNTNGEIHDLTEYVIGGEVRRLINQVSTAEIKLRNPEMKFTTTTEHHATFHPMDPITIFMERIPGRHVQVFTGYLDTTPYLQLFPGTITLKASCTLKRLLYNNFQMAQAYTISFFHHFGWNPLNGTLAPNQGGMVESEFETKQKEKWGKEQGEGKITEKQFNEKFNKQFEAREKKTEAGSLAAQETEGKKRNTKEPAFSTKVGALVENDGSFKKLIWAFLYYVADWNDANIYIEGMPKGVPELISTLWANFEKVENKAAKEELTAYWSALIGSSSEGSGGANGQIGGGKPGNLVGSKREFAEEFARKTGLNLTVVAAWLNHEQGTTTVEGGNNWLNVETGKRGGSGPHSAEAQYVERLTPLQAGSYSAQWLKENSNFSGILASVGKSPVAQAKAIIDSPWAGSHYNYISPEEFLTAAGNLTKEPTGGNSGAPLKKGLASEAEENQRGSTDKSGKSGTSTEGYEQYHFPFKKIKGQLTVERTDMGADYAIGQTAGEPLVAIGDGTWIAEINFYKGQPALSYQITQSGPLHGQIIYYSEGIEYANNPKTKQKYKKGDSFKGGEVIAVTTSQPTGIELGYAERNGAPLGTPEWNSTKDAANATTNFGEMFTRLMLKLGQKSQPNNAKVGNGQIVPNGPHEIVGVTGEESSGGEEGNTLSAATAASFLSQISFPKAEELAAAQILGGQKSLMNSMPVMNMVQQVCEASLRSFQSLPNGDFYAFYPDYFNEFGAHPPYWEVHDIEIINGEIDLSDDELATHVFAIGNTTWPRDIPIVNEINAGVMTIFEAFTPGVLYNQKATVAIEREKEAIAFMQRYGARPLKYESPTVYSSLFEQLLSYQQFLLSWARQFKTPFTFTFMPEIFPGGKIAFPEHGLQMYVESVTHTWDLDNGFETVCELMAPSIYKTSENASAVALLPENMVAALIEPQKGEVGKDTADPKQQPALPSQKQINKEANEAFTGVENNFTKELLGSEGVGANL